MRRISLLALSLVLALGVTAVVFAGDEAGCGPKVLMVKFHADWCGSCKAMGPIFEDLANKYDGRPALFVRLDLTNRTTKTQAMYMAHALGIGDVWSQYGNSTGFILLIDAETGKVIKKLTKEQTIKEMGTELVAAVEEGP